MKDMPIPSRSKTRAAVNLHRSLVAVGLGLAGSITLNLILGELLHRNPSRWNQHDGALLAILALIFVFVLIEVIGIVASTLVLWRHPELRNLHRFRMLAVGAVGVAIFIFVSLHPPGYFFG